MKVSQLLFFLLLLSGACFSQTVSVDSLFKYEGKTVTVCSKVVSTYTTRGENQAIYLNFVKPFPHNKFTVVIFENDLKNFSYNPSSFLANKNICVSGIIKFYKGKPEIIVRAEIQVMVAD